MAQRAGTVILFPTCLVDLLFRDAAAAAERVLRRAGCEVERREEAVCCGQVAWNSGHVDEARRVARALVDALDGEEPVVVCSGSCTTMLREHWPTLFAGTKWESRARAVAERAWEFSSFVADDLGVEALGALETAPTTAAYHDSCHMLRGLRIKEAPRRLLAAVDGLRVKDMRAQERCCGFGGTFSVRYPELSCAMADDKADDASGLQVDELVASDVGCLMQICGRAEARGVELRGRYIAEVLDEAMQQ